MGKILRLHYQTFKPNKYMLKFLAEFVETLIQSMFKSNKLW